MLRRLTFCLWVSLVMSSFAFGAQERQKDVRVFIIHGYMANTGSHWFPWLKKNIEQQGGKAEILDLPDSNNPKLSSWNRVLKNKINAVDAKTFIVAHSLGCITVLNYLSTLPENSTLGGLVCVSGFSEPLSNIPALNEFTKKKYDVTKVKRIVNKSVVVVAEDDSIVAPDLTRRLAKELEAPLRSVTKGGHFLDSDGFTEFPLVLSELTALVDGTPGSTDGLTREQIQETIQKNANSVMTCYESGLVSNPQLKGTLTLSLDIGAEGQVLKSEILKTTLKSPVVEECIVKSSKAWKFPKPVGAKPVHVEYPFDLKKIKK